MNDLAFGFGYRNVSVASPSNDSTSESDAVLSSESSRRASAIALPIGMFMMMDEMVDFEARMRLAERKA